jgi:chloramphenicol-sensitive protein RarD
MNRAEYIKGLFFGALAYAMWGLLPLYWKLVNVIRADQIFAQRIVWSFLFLSIILAYKNQFSQLWAVFQTKKNIVNGLLCTMFISINWFVYIWAVNNGFVIETSLGYFINPIVLTTFGAVLFKEKLNKLQWAGFVLATMGVLYLTITYNKIPYIALTLAVSFALYGVFKKKSKLDSIVGLSFETMILSGPALFYVLFGEVGGQGLIGNVPWIYWVLIALSGIATSVPLLLYAEATKRLPLGVVGFLQYIAPTISLVLGVFVFKEAFDETKLIAFTMIWMALALYSVAQYRLLKAST